MIDNPELITGFCDDQAHWVGAVWGLIEFQSCMEWALNCAVTVNALHPQHALSVGYHSDGRDCRALGVV